MRTISANERETEFSLLGWIELAAGASLMIGLAALIALFAQSAWAAGPPPAGFESGAKPIGNPFMPPPTSAKKDTFFDDEEEDEPPMPQAPGYAAANGQKPGAPGQAGAPGAGNVGDAQKGVSGVSLGGGPAGGVISKNKVDALHVDDETAEGSKDVVTDFNFPDADIMDIAKALGKLTGKNFILDKDVKGRITIISNAPITVGDAWKAFLTALDINNFALIPSGKYIRIARQRDARDKQLKTYTGDYSPDTDALITRLFPLKYLSSEEVARNFRSFMPANSRIIPYEQTNTVIVTDTGANIAKLAKLLEILDVEGYDAGIEVIPVKYASAVELSKLIDTLVPGTAPVPGAGGSPRFGGGGKFTARRTKEGGIINTIIADERTNTLIVHANGKGADQVRELVAKLDQKLPSTTGGGKVHVIYLQFAVAEEIANTMNNLSQQAQKPATNATGAGGVGVNPQQTTLFEGSIRVASDKATNSLVVTASPADFVTVQRVVNKLDIPRDQVYAEVVIMELNLGKDFEMNANIVSPVSGVGTVTSDDLLKLAAAPFSLGGAILGFKSGNQVTIPINGTNVQVNSLMGLLRVLQTRSNGNILARPQILALDNTEATFDTTENIPQPSSSAIQGAGVSTSFTKEKVSLSITIKPQINKVANFVKMDVTAKLADISNRVLPKNVQDNAIATFERNAKTSVVVADQDTVVIGGLTKDNVNDTVSKVPILGDIPLLGWLFSSHKTNVVKSNLLLFITPHIVRQYETVRAILDKKLRERDEFIESTTGGVDVMRPYRDEIIRSLPDMKEIAQKPVPRTFTIDADDSLPQDDAIKPEDKQPAKAIDKKSELQQPAAKPAEPQAPGSKSAPGATSAAPPAAKPPAPVQAPPPPHAATAPVEPPTTPAPEVPPPAEEIVE